MMPRFTFVTFTTGAAAGAGGALLVVHGHAVAVGGVVGGLALLAGGFYAFLRSFGRFG